MRTPMIGFARTQQIIVDVLDRGDTRRIRL